MAGKTKTGNSVFAHEELEVFKVNIRDVGAKHLACFVWPHKFTDLLKQHVMCAWVCFFSSFAHRPKQTGVLQVLNTERYSTTKLPQWGPSTCCQRSQVMKEVLNNARNTPPPISVFLVSVKASKLGSDAGRLLP